MLFAIVSPDKKLSKFTSKYFTEDCAFIVCPVQSISKLWTFLSFLSNQTKHILFYQDAMITYCRQAIYYKIPILSWVS